MRGHIFRFSCSRSFCLCVCHFIPDLASLFKIFVFSFFRLFGNLLVWGI